MIKSYNEIIELEYLDSLMKDYNFNLIVAILLLLIEKLQIEACTNPYHFEVIPYGFQGYYPVIGVQHKTTNLPSIEGFVINFFNTSIPKITLKEFLEFNMINSSHIEDLLANISRENAHTGTSLP